MQRLLILSAVLAVFGLVGCNETERGGKQNDKTPGPETFTLKGPTTSTTIKQGDKQTVKLTVNRGSKFKKDVEITPDVPKGLKVEVDPKTVKAADSETANAQISVDKDAAVGDHTIKFTAKPESGNAVTLDVKVKVEKKD